MTKEEIKKELEEIRYYNGRRDMFAKAFDFVGKNVILETTSRYNKLICDATPKLYEMYVALYINSCTYESASASLGYSINYVYKTNKKILEFFYSKLKDKEAA